MTKPAVMPSLGSSIHYIDAWGEHMAAIVTSANPDGSCDVTFFHPCDSSNSTRERSALVGAAPKAPYDASMAHSSWHWPSDDAAK